MYGEWHVSGFKSRVGTNINFKTYVVGTQGLSFSVKISLLTFIARRSLLSDLGPYVKTECWVKKYLQFYTKNYVYLNLRCMSNS